MKVIKTFWSRRRVITSVLLATKAYPFNEKVSQNRGKANFYDAALRVFHAQNV